jgi:hypothetical protein
LNEEEVLVDITNEWHFQKDVYERQIKEKALSSSDQAEKSERESSYKLLLSQSFFSLCPSGSGPNSIRLWESIGFGSIPVLLADGLSLPWVDVGYPYETGIIVVSETDSSINRLPALLQELGKDSSFLAAKGSEMKMLWEKYWIDSFVRPIVDFVGLAGSSTFRSAPRASSRQHKNDFASNLYLHLRGFLYYASRHESLKKKWPTGFESIIAFVLEAKHGVDYGAEYVKAMLVESCKKAQGVSPYITLLHLLDELV